MVAEICARDVVARREKAVHFFALLVLTVAFLKAVVI